ncbi:MAG TPA: ABC transporter ATP-binding protein [Solirubrobacteraceae bacterium]|jgi:ABC-type Fe3+/spermidine/putrescine transport system ATPase subunit|nr:ABC transporter ATP-binding protein [Solirubrobacteraceae bacterium]
MTTSAPSAVKLDALTKRYGSVEALSEVSLSLAPGRFLVLLGPSGSGKSTLIRCLAGIERPSDGTIELAGAAVAARRTHVPPERRDLAMVFQDFALWPHLTVARNVAFALRRRRPSKAEASKRVSQILERVGLGHLAARYPHELSGGEQQRVALARALVGRPSLLLFDEPLSSLDANLRERLRIEIGTLVREIGASAVYITHDQGEAFALGDEVGVLERGRLVQHDTPEDVYRRPTSAFVARFTGLAGELRGRVLTAPGSEHSPGGTTLPRAIDGGAPLPPRRAGRDLVRVLITPDGATRAGELLASCTEPLSPGQAVEVLIRPAAVTLTASDDPESCLHGTVLDSAFRGRGYDHVVRLPDGAVLSEIFASHSHQRGQAVGLRIDPDGCLTFAVGSASAPGHTLSTAHPTSGPPDRAGASGERERVAPEGKPDHDSFHAIT